MVAHCITAVYAVSLHQHRQVYTLLGDWFYGESSRAAKVYSNPSLSGCMTLLQHL